MLFRILISVMFLFANPWGKDADLVYSPLPSPKPTYTTLAEKLIRFHQEVISPADGPRSHFIPSSSQYTLDAIRRYGFVEGFLRGCDRLQRENNEPWVYRKTLDGSGREMKWDPIR